MQSGSTINRAALSLTVLSLMPCAASAITLGQLDTFDLSTQAWTGSWQASGGPAGAGDGFVMITSNGSGGPGGKLVSYNRTQWSGNYLAAGVDSIALSLNNLGATDLNMRVAVGTDLSPMNGGSWYASTQDISLPASSGWTDVEFSLSADAMTNTQGAASLDTVLQNVVTLRILHSSVPDDQGDPILAMLGMDNIEALAAVADGDFDEDGDVDGHDFLLWQLGMSPGGGSAEDLAIWRDTYGTLSPNTAVLQGFVTAVPEPSTAVLLASLPVLLAARRFVS